MASFNGWATALLRSIDAPLTQQNLKALNAWQRAEGGTAAFNPLNTTQPAQGASNYNSVGVRNYRTPAQGLQATKETLLNGHYQNIISLLRSGRASAADIATAVAQSPWGTGNGVLRVLGASPSKSLLTKGTPTAPAKAPAQAMPAALGTSPQQALAALMLAQSSATAQGQPDTGSLLAMALLRNQLGSAQQVYGAQQPASPSSAPAIASGPKAATQKAPRSLLPFIGAATTGVKPSLLSSVSAAAKAAGATKIRITSGYRSPAHNAQVGGVSHSNHMTGDAIDGYGLVNGRWVPLGQLLLNNAGKFGLRSGDVPGFFNGNPDPVHVDDGANVR